METGGSAHPSVKQTGMTKQGVRRELIRWFTVYVGVACQPADVSTDVTDVDYQVYSAFLNARTFYKNVPPEYPVVVYDSTGGWADAVHPTTTWTWVTTHLGDRCRYDKDEVRCRKAQNPAWVPLFETLKQPVYHRPLPLQARFNVRYPVRVLSRSQAWAMSDNNEDRSRNVYLFGFSNIAYNPGQTRALFF